MPLLSRAIAEYIVKDALGAQTSLGLDQIEASSSIDALGLDRAAQLRAQEKIVDVVERMGFYTKFSIDQFSEAQTVGDLVDLLLDFTDSSRLR